MSRLTADLSFARLSAFFSAHTSSDSAAADALAGRLAEEMNARWRKGERPGAEEFLARHPELGQHLEAVLHLLYEEICLRQEDGQEDPAAQVLDRFPQWRPQLQLLLECQRLLEPGRAPQARPRAGERLGDYQLLTELGRGAQGSVFLATQSSLADRPVVLKLTACAGREHLSLARLQHTHIVPLYAVHEEPARQLRILCMPYFGGATLARLLEELRDRPASRRGGRDLVEALDRLQAAAPVALPPRGAARQFLAGTSYVRAVCWIGACLAEALHYAHERGLVHLDLKPANVLLAADGTPMLLDFHLAREPLRPDEAAPNWLGGTPLYMAPEQAAALTAVHQGRSVPRAVDGRADVYALGLLLYELLGGPFPVDVRARPRLHRHNPSVSPGLAALVHKCLAPEPADRYAGAAALAADLRRHLADLPLHGVANPSLLERWRKWRRRRPYALAVAGTFGVLLGAVLVVVAWARERYAAPQAALRQGQHLLRKGEFTRAVEVLQHGRDLAEALPGSEDLQRELGEELHRAREAESRRQRVQAAEELRRLAERIRFFSVADPLPLERAHDLEPRCRALWHARSLILDAAAVADAPVPDRLRSDLLDLVLIWTDLRIRLASATALADVRREILRVLADTETLLGPGPALERERRRHLTALGQPQPDLPVPPPRTAWDHFTLGRSLFQAGDLAGAADEFARAVEREPGLFWPHFYQGLCAYRRGRHAEAVSAFGTCVALAPETAACYHNRALALAALGEVDRAAADYTQALRLEPGLAAAALNRGLLHYRGGRYAEALRDLEQARKSGADPAVVCYNLGVVHLAAGNPDQARASLEQALGHDPEHKEARGLLERLRRKP